MIINGNYKWFDIESLKPLFIEASVKVFGEEFRDTITQKINAFKYHPYHSIEYVTDYYNAYIYSFRDEIAEEFFKLSGIEPSEKIRNFIIPTEYNAMPPLFYAVEGGLDIEKNTNYTKEGIYYIKEIRSMAIEDFGLTGTDEEIYKQLITLRNYYSQAEQIVEDRHKCDVTEDMNTLSNNAINTVKRFLAVAKNAGYDVDFQDIYSMGNSAFNVSDIFNLKSAKILFGGDIQTPGLIKAFTSESNKKLKNATQVEKLDIIIDRLKYLETLGLPFKFISQEELHETSDQEDFVQRVLQEYNYQKTCPNEINYIDYWGYTYEEIKKQFRKGQFFPEHLADTLEEDREELCELLVEGCKFHANKEPYPINSEFQNFVSYNYEDLDMFKPYSDLYVLEDRIITEQDFIHNMSHEVCHILGCGLPQMRDPKTNVITSKSGVNFRRNIVDEDNKIMLAEEDRYAYNLTYDLIMQKLEEYINEQQGKEIAEELYKLNIDLGFEEDTIAKPELASFVCVYDFYDFIARDFYESYYEELKRHKVDDSYNIFFRDSYSNNIFDNKFQNMLTYLRGKYNRLINAPNYAEEGVVDYQKVHKLAELIEEFHKDIYPYLARQYSDSGYVDFAYLDPRQRRQIEKLIARKDRIMGSIISDEKIVRPPLTYMMYKE